MYGQGLGFSRVIDGVVLTDDPYADLLRSAEPGDVVPIMTAAGGIQPKAPGLNISGWIERNKNAVYLGAAVLVAMAMFSGKGRR